MKRKIKKIICFFLLLFILLVFMLYSVQSIFLQEDLIFFQFFHSKNKSQINVNKQNTDKQNERFTFYVTYKNTDLKSVNLLETINNKTLVYEKIAPGTSGQFQIILKSKSDLQYGVTFISKNEKPSNLHFSLSEKGTKYTSLEELSNVLKGDLSKDEEKIVNIYWEWNYETNNEGNKQDKIEKKKLKAYQFLIYVKGY